MISTSLSQSLAQPISRAIGGTPSVVLQEFPSKDFYFTDFSGIANGTTLRSLDGWGAYSSPVSSAEAQNAWVVDSGTAFRSDPWGSGDYDPNAGAIIVAYAAPSLDQVFKFTLAAKPNASTAVNAVVCATDNKTCLVVGTINISGRMQYVGLNRIVDGVSTSLFSEDMINSNLKRYPVAGDVFEVRVVGRKAQLLISGIEVTQAGGTDLDQGGVTFTKGHLCGFGTREGSGTRFGPLYVAPLVATLSVAATPVYWPGLLYVGRSVPLSGTYTGEVLALDYRVVNAVTLAELKPWARVSAPTIAAGEWAAEVFVPMYDDVINPTIKVQLRAANDVDAAAMTNATTVGFTAGLNGQSNSQNMGQGGATPYPSANAYTWSTSSASVWHKGAMYTDTRAGKMAALLSSRLGVPCGIFVHGTGSAAVAELLAEGPDDGIGSRELFGVIEADCAASYSTGYIGVWVHTQMEAEASGSIVNVPQYRSDAAALFDKMRSRLSSGMDVPVGINVIGPYTGTHIEGEAQGDINWSLARATLFGLTDLPNVFIASNLISTPMADDYHYTADGYVENGRRLGLSVAKRILGTGYDGRGPLITGATRSGAVVTLAVDLNGAVSIAGTGLTNYDVSTDDFATKLIINSAVVSGSNIVLTLSADPVAPVKVRSFYGMNYGTPTRAIGTYADGTTIPVEPIFNFVESGA